MRRDEHLRFIHVAERLHDDFDCEWMNAILRFLDQKNRSVI